MTRLISDFTHQKALGLISKEESLEDVVLASSAKGFGLASSNGTKFGLEQVDQFSHLLQPSEQSKLGECYIRYISNQGYFWC